MQEKECNIKCILIVKTKKIKPGKILLREACQKKRVKERQIMSLMRRKYNS